MARYTIEELKNCINKFPRERLIHSPTPLRKLENLTQELGGPDIFIKRDDMTGLAFGGNKSRKLEYIIADVLKKKADTIITWASVQSNWCLQTAAVANKYGIKPVLILFKTYDIPEEFDGNLLLDFILDADIRFREGEAGRVVQVDQAKEVLKEISEEIRKEGHRPYIAPIGGSMVGADMELPLGAVGYVDAVIELKQQFKDVEEDMDYIIHATGSGGTQAGMVVGAKAVMENTKVLGVSVSEKKDVFSKDVLTICRDTVRALELKLEIDEDDVMVFDDYIQDGYGVVNKEVSEAVRLMAHTEGIFLDPVYTGKAMVALVDLIKREYFNSDDKVVFIHTGGTPALFPNKYLISKFLN